MSLQKAIEAIEILEQFLKTIDKENHSFTYLDVYTAIMSLKEYQKYTTPDTQYKIDLTAWIERKEKDTFDSSQEHIREYFKAVLNKVPSPEIERAMHEMKKERHLNYNCTNHSIISAKCYCRICREVNSVKYHSDRILNSTKGSTCTHPLDSYKKLTLEQKQLFNESLMDSVEVCPRTTEGGEG